MKRVLLAMILSIACTPRAMALRPFDGTDAAVAGKGVLEFEFGYLGLLREDGRTFLLSPALVANAGLMPGTELVAEGRIRTRLRGRPDGSGSALEDLALSVKHVWRDGVLQDATGPSIASECGMLLPAAAGERTGFACTGIVSQRAAQATLHVNGSVASTREHRRAGSLGVIVEGPRQGKLEPVFEATAGAADDGTRSRAALAGLIVALADNFAFDFGIRIAREGGMRVSEVRGGLTWSRRR